MTAHRTVAGVTGEACGRSAAVIGNPHQAALRSSSTLLRDICFRAVIGNDSCRRGAFLASLAVALILASCGGSGTASSTSGSRPSPNTREDTGSLAHAFATLSDACSAAPSACGQPINPGASDPVSAASGTLCSDAAKATQPLLQATGLSSTDVSGQGRFEAEGGSTVQTGFMFPGDAPVAGCVDDEVSTFGFWLAKAPPASLNAPPEATRTLSFGKPCDVFTGVDSQFGKPAVDLACITPSGWAFDVAAAHDTTVSDAVLQKVYYNLLAAL